MPDDAISRDLAADVVNKPLVTFYRMVDTGLAPQAADRSAGGLLPTRAFRYCEAVTTASAFGWYVFPPIAFSLLWDGTCVHWSCDGEQTWSLLQRAQFPDFAARFDALAPEEARGFPPPFLGALPEPGVVQVWSGMLARTLPDWSLLLRAPANIPKQGHYDLFEGIVETDRWFGPLFTNVRLTKTDVPVRFDANMPLFQIQPLPRSLYLRSSEQDFVCINGIDALGLEDWRDFGRTVVAPSSDDSARHGADAVRVRRRRKRDCSPQPI